LTSHYYNNFFVSFGDAQFFAFFNSVFNNIFSSNEGGYFEAFNSGNNIKSFGCIDISARKKEKNNILFALKNLLNSYLTAKILAAGLY
jgi:hypothetical protein